MAYKATLYATPHKSHMNDLARTPRQIGAIIQRARKKRDWSQMQLAEKSGLRQATISMIETGQTTARLETILAILAALDLEFRIGARTKGHDQDIEALF
jgi:HTH-type transcriptional regulator/antitoxin HipB